MKERDKLAFELLKTMLTGKHYVSSSMADLVETALWTADKFLEQALKASKKTAVK